MEQLCVILQQCTLVYVICAQWRKLTDSENRTSTPPSSLLSIDFCIVVKLVLCSD